VNSGDMVHFRLNDLYNLRFLVGAMAGRSNLGTCIHVVSAPASPVSRRCRILRMEEGGKEEGGKEEGGKEDGHTMPLSSFLKTSILLPISNTYEENYIPRRRGRVASSKVWFSPWRCYLKTRHGSKWKKSALQIGHDVGAR